MLTECMIFLGGKWLYLTQQIYGLQCLYNQKAMQQGKEATKLLWDTTTMWV